MAGAIVLRGFFFSLLNSTSLSLSLSIAISLFSATKERKKKLS
jgi:hypothetical protein